LNGANNVLLTVGINMAMMRLQVVTWYHLIGLTYDGKTNQTLRVHVQAIGKMSWLILSRNLKFDGTLAYRVNEKLEVSYTYRVGRWMAYFKEEIRSSSMML
jgi:hypothetical protein